MRQFISVIAFFQPILILLTILILLSIFYGSAGAA